MVPGGSHKICMIQDMFPGFDTYYKDPAQHIPTAGHHLDDLSDDLSTDLPLLVKGR